MRLKRTERGFMRADFKDCNGDACSIQESSAMGLSRIWLGLNEGTHHHVTGDCMARMHVDRKLAKKLIAKLQLFVETGGLRRRRPSPTTTSKEGGGG